MVLDAAWLTNIRVCLDVLLGDIDALNQHATVLEHLQNSAATALVFAGSNDDFVAFSNFVHIFIRGPGPVPTALLVREK